MTTDRTETNFDIYVGDLTSAEAEALGDALADWLADRCKTDWIYSRSTTPTTTEAHQ